MWFLRCCCPGKSARSYTRTRHSLAAPKILTLPCFEGDGEIHVEPPLGAVAPVRAHWSGGSQPIRQSVDTLRATHLQPGWYSVHVADARGWVSGATTVRVEPAHVPTVTGYEVRDASSDLSRDGSVTARLQHTTDDVRLVWSNGAATLGPELCGVCPGTYVATVVQSAGEPCKCLHACMPAVVDVSETEAI
jgi:hypothetical protein